ncbi:MAG: hypothetical protein K8I60_18880 [Anaerolineae bacterium]|nr:hypothetical protein [Anaerolineae bacterium]
MKHLQFKVFVSLAGILLLIGTIMPTLAQEAVSIAPPDGHNPDFDATAAEEESYWYSRYSLMSLVMQSGNGVMADVPMDMVMGAVGMVDANPDDGDSVTVPQNVALLGMVYAGGDPHFTTAMNPDDFGTMRWVGGNASVTLEASS